MLNPQTSLPFQAACQSHLMGLGGLPTYLKAASAPVKHSRKVFIALVASFLSCTGHKLLLVECV